MRSNDCTLLCVICVCVLNFKWLMTLAGVVVLKQHALPKCFWLFPFSPATVDASTHQDHRNQKNPLWGLLPTGIHHSELTQLWEDVFYTQTIVPFATERICSPTAEVLLFWTLLFPSVNFNRCINLLNIIHKGVSDDLQKCRYVLNANFSIPMF